MFGIGTKSAKFIATASLALGIGAFCIPAAEAGDDHRRHGFHGHHHRHHGHHRHHAHRHHGHWRSGVTVHVWDAFPPRPVIRHVPAVRACHPVIGQGFDRFGRRAKFGGTMCYDGYGNGYIVAGSQHVIHYF
jgi:hypothetical protein